MTVFLPPPDTNPYLRLLAGALAQCQVTVRTMPVVLSEQWLFAAQVKGGAVLHFHWPSYGYTHGDHQQMAEYVRDWAKALARAKAAGVKIVWTVHNLYPHEQVHADLEHEATQILLDHCDAVIAHCPAAVVLLREHFQVAAQCAVIPHGHYIGVYGAPVETVTARRALGIPEQGAVYLFFGQLRAYKGLERLVQVFASLPETRGTLLVAGHTGDAVLARKLIGESRSHTNIFVHPFFVPDREVGLYLGAADVVVLPYTDVLTSGAAVLAHSMGRPVIAPRLGCLAEMVGEGTGWLYDADSEEGLRRALEVANGRLSEACSERCVEFVRGRDWGGVGEKTIEVYRCGA